MTRSSLLIVLLVLTACADRREEAAPDAPASPSYLYVWGAAADSTRGSFLGVYDIRPDVASESRLVRIVPADSPSRGAHHIEHEVSSDGQLLANAFGSGRTFLFDVRKADEPIAVAAIGDVGPFSHPHSYVRLPNGNAIATFQWKVGGTLPGGLVELDRNGQPVRWASAATTEADSLQIVPYSLAVLPQHDRIVSTSTHMIEDIGVHVQIWRLSDLKLLRTLPVPLAAEHNHTAHDSAHHMLPGEPRVLTDGRTVMFGTFTCGLYHVTGVAGDNPQVVFSRAFPGANCAVPVVIGKYWVQTVPALHALVALDVTDPAHPVEVSQLVLGEETEPHWVAADASGRRLVATSANRRDPTLHFVDFDPGTGVLTRNANLPVLALRGLTWPDGYRGDAIPHGLVFSRH